MFDNKVDISKQYGSKKVEPKYKLPEEHNLKPIKKSKTVKSKKVSKWSTKKSNKPTRQQKYEYFKEKENERFWINNL